MRKPAQSAAQRRADNVVIRRALKLLEDRLVYGRNVLDNPCLVRDFLRLRLGQIEHEVFIALWLDTRKRLIACDEIFRGTLNCVSVYPREVVKSALAHNADSVILAHNHPSGLELPSNADKDITDLLKKSLALVDVTVIDHFIVGGAKVPFSFAERGLL